MATIDEVLAHEDPTAFAIALSDLVFPRYDAHGFESLRPAERVAYCVDALEREVANGGFDLFFVNSAGDHAAETLAALREIGAPHAAALLEQAMAIFPRSRPPRDRDERTAFMETLEETARERLQDLDRRFDDYPDDLTSLMRDYVAAHRDEFRPWP